MNFHFDLLEDATGAKYHLSDKHVGIPTKARAGFSLEGWLLRGRPLQGSGTHFRQD